jgi:hypothetical protein
VAEELPAFVVGRGAAFLRWSVAHAGPGMPAVADYLVGHRQPFAVLDDANLTGIGQSSADELEVPVGLLAEKLTSHLVRGIMIRGSPGGPSAPLADQPDDDVIHLPGRNERRPARLRLSWNASWIR